jgi:hypothetical protein
LSEAEVIFLRLSASWKAENIESIKCLGTLLNTPIAPWGQGY